MSAVNNHEGTQMCLPVEPFKVEREWEAFGLKCAVTQPREGYHRCGYVRLPLGHPDYGKPYRDVDVDVHGGLTFAELEPCEHEDGRGYWVGFDCGHAFDAMFDPDHVPAFEAGFRRTHQEFDRLHLGEHYWTQPEVEAETENLARQLAERL